MAQRNSVLRFEKTVPMNKRIAYQEEHRDYDLRAVSPGFMRDITAHFRREVELKRLLPDKISLQNNGVFRTHLLLCINTRSLGAFEGGVSDMNLEKVRFDQHMNTGKADYLDP